MIKLVLAPNAFKESLSAPAAADAMERGAKRARGDIVCAKAPVADGGDGTAEALVAARGGEMVRVTAGDPLMRPVEAAYGLIDGGETAVVEMAAASGLWRLREEEKNPLETTTFGTGEMIRHALERGAKTIIAGIGGSATTDAGIGMAAALGYRFLDADGNELKPVGGSMAKIRSIGADGVAPQLREARILIASDVNNPLLGPEGAAPVFGPQKGATPAMVRELEEGLANVARLWKAQMGVSMDDTPGGGAAGGLGAGLMAFCGAECHSGFDLIADFARLDDAIRGASLVITGEGRIDASTRFGKAPAGVARRAKKQNVPAVALAGGAGGDLAPLHEIGLAAVFSIAPGPVSLEDALKNAAEYIERATEQVTRLWLSRY